MLTRVGKYVVEKSLVRDGDRILCMVSGGADSTAMMHILKQLSQPNNPEFPGTFSLGVCHVNYGRRGEASDEDEIFVRKLADRARVPMHVIQAPRKQRSNFQAWARGFRYLGAKNLCHWQGYTRIAVAHNMDDRIETFLYRLMTYSGRRSLVVMPPQRGRIIRPILFAASAEVRDYCAAEDIPYREDESNQSPDYVRNRIRQSLIPQMADIRPDFRDRITDTLSLLEDEDIMLASVAEEFWRLAAEEPDEVKTTALRAGEIDGMPRAAARLVIRRWLSSANVRVRLSRRMLDSIVALCHDTGGTSSISLPDGLQVQRRYDRLMLAGMDQAIAAATPGEAVPADDPAAGKEPEPPAQKENQEKVLAIPGKTIFGRFEIEAVEPPAWELNDSDPLQATIDFERLDGPLQVRRWRHGDRFMPLGLGGSKSIQDLFTDEKVARPERENLPLVTCGDRIVWVCGLRLSEEFKVTGSSRRLIGLKATRRPLGRAI